MASPPSITEAGRLLRAGRVTSRDLTTGALVAAAAMQERLHAFVVLDHDAALEAADAADAALAAGRDLGPLHGMPVAIKDIVDMSGLPTRCGSPAYPDTPVPHDATVVSRLRAGGGVLFGKTTAHELACGVYSAPARNPWDTERIPGGSSGGSGAAVAAGICLAALGSDTGGSIRIPAAVCGVVGFKPTYGSVSTQGVEPLSWSLDHIGPIGRTVADCAAVLDVIAEPGERAHDFQGGLDDGVHGLRLGVHETHFGSAADPEVLAAFGAACEQLADLGAELVSVRIPELAHTLAAEFGIVGPEAASYHASRLRTRTLDIGPIVRGVLLAGALLPGAQYVRALRARRVIANAVRDAFRAQRLDALVCPTLPAAAARVDQTVFDFGEPERVGAAYVRTTAPFNLTGQPALSVPCGFTRDGLPIGLQIAAAPFHDAMVLRVGAAYEAGTPWHLARPPVSAASDQE